ncbi:sigma-70 family RNA polymerase sigma factor [soil metagenome]
MSAADPPPSRDAEFARIALPQLPAVARVARALTRDAADADDLVQDTYLKAFRHWNTFDQDGDCRRWLSAICRNTFFAQRQRQSWLTAVGDDHELETFAAVSLHTLAREKGVEDMFARLDLGPAIRSAIAALDPGYREVVQRVDVEELRYEEAADLLGIPIGTVRSRLYRARRLLQSALVNYAKDANYVSVPSAALQPSTLSATDAES